MKGIPELAPLKKLKVAELRTLCSSNQVPQTGTKDVMIQRLDSLRRSSSGKSSAVIPLTGSTSTASRSGAATPESTSKQRGGRQSNSLTPIIDRCCGGKKDVSDSYFVSPSCDDFAMQCD
jgi:hypothetical protein